MINKSLFINVISKSIVKTEKKSRIYSENVCYALLRCDKQQNLLSNPI